MNDQHTRVDEDVSESSDDGGGAYDRCVFVLVCVCARACVREWVWVWVWVWVCVWVCVLGFFIV